VHLIDNSADPKAADVRVAMICRVHCIQSLEPPRQRAHINSGAQTPPQAAVQTPAASRESRVARRVAQPQAFQPF
jgi:hypothetical protein